MQLQDGSGGDNSAEMTALRNTIEALNKKQDEQHAQLAPLIKEHERNKAIAAEQKEIRVSLQPRPSLAR